MTDRHIMLDLETFGTAKDAAIVSIGACTLDPDTGHVPNPEVHNFACFHKIIDLEKTPAASPYRAPARIVRAGQPDRDTTSKRANRPSKRYQVT